MDARTQQLLTAPPASLLVKMATPNALAFLIQGFVSMAEVWFISRLGTTSLAAIALALFSIAAAMLFHSNFGDKMQTILFMKNITMAGGLLLLAVSGATAYSIDKKIQKKTLF